MLFDLSYFRTTGAFGLFGTTKPSRALFLLLRTVKSLFSTLGNDFPRYIMRSLTAAAK